MTTDSDNGQEKTLQAIKATVKGNMIELSEPEIVAGVKKCPGDCDTLTVITPIVTSLVIKI